MQQIIRTTAKKLCDNIGSAVFGKEKEIGLVVAALLCSGHVLLNDVPGTGKTSLARALAASIRSESDSYRRIQFTPDLLPSDITGIHYYNQKEGAFVFRRGPLFANVIIADEINRTTPRTQSALLECMEEYQVTVDGETHPLPRPFFVIATQNPIESQGTFPLPEAQIDRFLIRLSLGYPDPAHELEILTRCVERPPVTALQAVCSAGEVLQAQEETRRITVSDAVRAYIVRLVTATRESDRLRLGASPRASLALLHMAQALAAMDGRDYVLPDDVKAACVPVLAHRVVPRTQNAIRLSATGESIVEYIVSTVPVITKEA